MNQPNRYLLPLLIGGLTAVPALAQTDTVSRTDIERAGFSMTKATIEFLANDARQFKQVKETACNTCLTYADLIRYTQENGLLNADRRVEEAEDQLQQLLRQKRGEPLTTDVARRLLTDFKGYLTGKVTTGKPYRLTDEKMDYQGYQSRLNDAIEDVATPADPEGGSVIALNQHSDDDDEDVVAAAPAPNTDAGGWSAGTWALLLSVLNTIGLVLLWLRQSRTPTPPAPAAVRTQVDELKTPAPTQSIDKAQFDKLSRRIDTLEGAVQGIQDQLTELRMSARSGTAPTTAAAGTPASQPAPRSVQTQTNARPTPTLPTNNVVEPIRQDMGNVVENAPAPGVPVPGGPAPAYRSHGDPTGAPQQRSESIPAQPQGTPLRSDAGPTPPTAAPQPRSEPAPVGPANTFRSERPAPASAPVHADATRVNPPRPVGNVVASGNVAPGDPATNRPVFFARTADLGDGFSIDSLIEKPTRTMVYEIRVDSPTTAQFRVLDDPDSQRLALGDPFSYLNDACEYRTQPGASTHIQTDRPGQLVLQGAKWKIDRKAEISFY